MLLVCPPPPTSLFLLEAPSAMNCHPQRQPPGVAEGTWVSVQEGFSVCFVECVIFSPCYLLELK